jgi:carboxyl-terminal processing protease
MVSRAATRFLMIALGAILQICAGAAVNSGVTVALADVGVLNSATLNDKATEVFDEVWRQVRDSFYDPKLHGLNWQAIGDEYRPRYASAKSDAERSAVINAMLEKLGASHTRHYTKDQPAYFQLVEIFSYPLRDGI